MYKEIWIKNRNLDKKIWNRKIFSSAISLASYILVHWSLLGGARLTKASDWPTETNGFLSCNQASLNIVIFLQLFALQITIPLVILTICNAIALVQLNFQIKEKIGMVRTNSQQRSDKANDGFTRLVIALATVCILSRLFDIGMTSLARLRWNGQPQVAVNYSCQFFLYIYKLF